MGKKNKAATVRANQRSYLNRDFDTFRSSLTEYGQFFFPEKINDFSENGLAGMFIELASYVGDTMSFYLDHQFNELDINRATETSNIERLIRNAGVKIMGASPALVEVYFYIGVPARLYGDDYEPDRTLLPLIREGTLLSSAGGVKFELLEELNFSLTDKDDRLYAQFTTMKTDSDGNPSKFAVKLPGVCSSAISTSESFSIPDKFVPFKTLTLRNKNVNEIMSITDTQGNEYFEVESLTQDSVFVRSPVASDDSELVPENLELYPAPYRFVKTTSRRTGLTSVRFGGGSALSTDDDIMPDPSEIAIPLYGKKTSFPRFALDPNKLLQTRTLGIAPRNTVINIRYRAGGGLSHNVSEGSIKSVSKLLTKFQTGVSASKIASVRASIEVRNEKDAKGGENAPTINELKSIALSFKNSQSRVVTKADLMARIYTMPSKFGRVFRVGIRSNPNNPLASVVSIISRDRAGNLIVSPDALKKNLQVYLNQFRLISDAIDIVDARVLNVRIQYSVTVDPSANKNLTLQNVNKLLKEYMKIENFQIEQPIVKSDLTNIIVNSPGVTSVINVQIKSISGTKDLRVYSAESFPVKTQTDRGVVYPLPGSIFEVKYPDDDIVGVAR